MKIEVEGSVEEFKDMEIKLTYTGLYSEDYVEVYSTKVTGWLPIEDQTFGKNMTFVQKLYVKVRTKNHIDSYVFYSANSLGRNPKTLKIKMSKEGIICLELNGRKPMRYDNETCCILS